MFCRQKQVDYLYLIAEANAEGLIECPFCLFTLSNSEVSVFDESIILEYGLAVESILVELGTIN